MIADKIKNARTIKKLTQEQVAEDLNVSRQTISNWENGKSLPDIVSIIRMSELYDLSLDELLKGDATLLNKIERDMKVAKAENNVIKFAWISIVIGVVMIILGNVFDDNPFIDFISAALPWVFLGLMCYLPYCILIKKMTIREMTYNMQVNQYSIRFIEKGLAGVSMSMIADKIGIKKLHSINIFHPRMNCGSNVSVPQRTVQEKC